MILLVLAGSCRNHGEAFRRPIRPFAGMIQAAQSLMGLPSSLWNILLVLLRAHNYTRRAATAEIHAMIGMMALCEFIRPHCLIKASVFTLRSPSSTAPSSSRLRTSLTRSCSAELTGFITVKVKTMIPPLSSVARPYSARLSTTLLSSSCNNGPGTSAAQTA